MMKIRVADNQVEIYSDNRIIELVGGPLTDEQSRLIVLDWFNGRPMESVNMSGCVWYHEASLIEYVNGGII